MQIFLLLCVAAHNSMPYSGPGVSFSSALLSSIQIPSDMLLNILPHCFQSQLCPLPRSMKIPMCTLLRCSIQVL